MRLRNDYSHVKVAKNFSYRPSLYSQIQSVEFRSVTNDKSPLKRN